MKKMAIILFCLLCSAFGADQKSALDLIDVAKAHSPNLQAAIIDTFEAKALKEGTAWAGHGQWRMP